jgi:hypothetical protein
MNEEVHNFRSSLNIVKMIKSRRMSNANRILGAKPEEKRPLGRPRHG